MTADWSLYIQSAAERLASEFPAALTTFEIRVAGYRRDLEELYRNHIPYHIAMAVMRAEASTVLRRSFYGGVDEGQDQGSEGR